MMAKKKQALITAAFLGAVLFSVSTMAELHINLNDKAAPIFTLTDVVALAIRNNTSLKQDELSRISDKFDLLLAKWNFRPQYSLGSNYTYNHSATGGSSGSRSFSITPKAILNSHYGTTFTLTSTNSWDYDNATMASPFSSAQYNPGLTFEIKQQLSQGVSRAVVDAALNEAEDNELINKLKFQDDVTAAIGAVVSNYVQLINDQLSLQSNEENLATLEETVKNTRLQIKAGQQAQYSLVDAQSQVASSKLSIEQAKNTVFSAREALLDSIGLQPNTSFRLPKDLNKELVHDAAILSGGKSVPDLATSEQDSLQNNSSYQVAAIAVKGAARSLMTTKDKNRWDLSLDASRTQGGSSSGASGLFNGKNATDKVSLDLSVPINDLKNKADLVKTQIALENSISSLSKAKRQLFSNVRDDLNSVVSTKEQLELAGQAVALQQKNVNMAEKLHQFGRTSTFELLQKQEQLVSDKASVITAETSYLNSLVAFDTQLNDLLKRWDISIRY